MKKAIIFDLDDTLIPSSQFYASAVAETLGGSESKIAAFQQARLQVKGDLPPLHTSARNRLLYFKRYQEIYNDEAASPLDLYDTYERHLSQLIRAWVVRHERLELLESWASQYPLYILTNENTRSQLAKIEALCRSKKIFSGVLTSEEAGCEKPDPRIFQLCFRRFNLQPEHCLYVGDSAELDMIPAQRLGVTCVQSLEFADKKDLPSPPWATINHLSQLVDSL